MNINFVTLLSRQGKQETTLKAVLLAILAISYLFISSSSIASDSNRFDIGPETAHALDSVSTAFYDQGLFNGAVMIAMEGEVVFSGGYGYANEEWAIPNTPDTRFNLASLSKQFTAVAILILVEEGRLSLDEPVSKYLPGLRKEISEQMTIRQLLTHTSGLPDESLIPGLRIFNIIHTREALLSAINEVEILFEPGSRYSYSNSGYNILALIIESISGQEFSQFLQDRIFTPLQMKNSCFKSDHDIVENVAYGYTTLLGQHQTETETNSSVYMMGAGNVFSSANDLLLWDQALSNHTLISEESTTLMFTPHKSNHGFGWYLSPNYYIKGTPVPVASGSGRGQGVSTVITRFLEDRLLVVCLANMQEAKVSQLSDMLVGILADGEARSIKPSAEAQLQKILFSEGIDQAADFYGKARNNGEFIKPTAGGLNRLAYQFLRSGRTAQALKVFELYFHLYTASSYAHDGYAEALSCAGEKDSAFVFYTKAIELSFNNIAAKRMLKHFGVSDPIQVHSPAIRIILDSSIESSLTLYEKLNNSNTALSENYINTVAYNLMRHGKDSDGVKLFEFNVNAFPNSANVWDSYAETLMQSGNNDLAIKYYRKSLELNPKNSNAQKMLEQLEK